jgi:fatty acyl-CoA reductase
VKIERPDFKNRVVVLDGDHTKFNLNLPLKCREELLSKINVVFHLAATVNFDDNIKTAFNINVKGTENVLSFCKECHHLKVIQNIYCHDPLKTFLVVCLRLYCILQLAKKPRR